MEYPRVKIIQETTDTDTLEIHQDRIIDVINGLVEIKQAGELKHKAFYLSPNYDWIVVKDSTDALCLVPLRKEK